jgi:predicted TIM-barrel enzyme
MMSFSTPLLPTPVRGRPTLIAMVHVPSNNAITNTVYNDAFGVGSYTCADVEILDDMRVTMSKAIAHLQKITGLEISECRSAVFALSQKDEAYLRVLDRIRQMPLTQRLVQRALDEVNIYTLNGISFIEIENVGAPYFIGNTVPIEDLFLLHIVCQSVRAVYPTLLIGVHVLSGNELESLPIAIACGACFVRSEATIFSGHRPEGRTINRGNLARFMYYRNYIHAKLGVEDPKKRRWPQIWSDLQKKHTVFDSELQNLDTWLHNILFMKLEGVIITGAATGSDIPEDELRRAREAIDKTKAEVRKFTAAAGHDVDKLPLELSLPLITGSGFDMKMYCKYADYIITGTQLKRGKYWENAVDENNVRAAVTFVEQVSSMQGDSS